MSVLTICLATRRPVLSNEDAGRFAAGAHSDYGCLTILYAPMPGLQILKGSEWLDVQPLSDGFVINIGDMLERWTGGVYKSTIHRVVNRSGEERFSCPFFFEPDFKSIIKPLPGYEPNDVCGYQAVTSGEYLLQRYSETHDIYNEKIAGGGAKTDGYI